MHCKKIWIDVSPGEAPEIGMYIASIGRQGRINSVYMVMSWRAVRRRDPGAPPRFVLNVQSGYSKEDLLAGGKFWGASLVPAQEEIRYRATTSGGLA